MLGWGFIDVLFFSPLLDPIRHDPRFQAKLQTTGFVEFHARAQAWRAAHPPDKNGGEEMSDATKAVFLSYASQDAEAAKRICEALRAAGVEVWFDQSELVGGDAWDQKIRRQIKDCALLIPIISTATQARTEGYFRLEWRLADQRTHLMAKGRPFLLPVVIDDTRDADAHVPDSFTEVQWTRALGGETSPAFAPRVKKLLSGEQGAGSKESGVGASLDGARDLVRDGRRQATPLQQPRRWLAPVIGGAVVALLALVIARPWRNGSRLLRSRRISARRGNSPGARTDHSRPLAEGGF